MINTGRHTRIRNRYLKCSNKTGGSYERRAENCFLCTTWADVTTGRGCGFERKSGSGRGGSITVVIVLNCGGGIVGTPVYDVPLILMLVMNIHEEISGLSFERKMLG